ncbi:MAG: hydrogenase maturation nickel metallochaperone HypA [Anaerolineae bacterium]|nr:hydrogenase maturation nickel metallochaperone HypA [Anaerolineae bacterium]MDW8172000.1 hydrogenase maturation nickel metallochaperone HypA [Anaerolineae bacterium]
MHELSITQNILNIALEHADKHHAQRITAIRLVIGQLSSFVDDAIQFYWDIISDGTQAKGAQLVFQRVPARLQCQACGHDYPLDGESYACPRCGQDAAKVVGGREFYIESIDIQIAEDNNSR